MLLDIIIENSYRNTYANRNSSRKNNSRKIKL